MYQTDDQEKAFRLIRQGIPVTFINKNPIKKLLDEVRENQIKLDDLLEGNAVTTYQAQILKIILSEKKEKISTAEMSKEIERVIKDAINYGKLIG